MPPNAAHCASRAALRPCRSLTWRRWALWVVGFAAVLFSAAAAQAQTPEPLHQRIDRAIEAAHPGRSPRLRPTPSFSAASPWI